VSAKIIRDDPPPLRALRSDVPEAMESLVARCLEKDPKKRFADVAELARGLGELGSDDAKKAAVRVAKVRAAVGPTFRAEPLTVRGGGAVRRAVEMIRAGAAASEEGPRWTLRILIGQGEADRVVGATGSGRVAAAVRSDDVTLRVVPGGYHEPFNDPGGEALADEVASWVRARAAAPVPPR